MVGVVLTTHPNGRPRHVVRVPIFPQVVQPIEFSVVRVNEDAADN